MAKGRALRRNLAVTCAHCLGSIWQARRDEIDAGKRGDDLPLARVLIGQRRRSATSPAAAFEVVMRRAGDLPEHLRAWVAQAAKAAIRRWLDWGVLTLDDLRAFTAGYAVAPTTFTRGADVSPFATPTSFASGGRYAGTQTLDF